jgi:site-specific recombinase XerD
MYHALRHYGASKLDNLGVALSDIQALLGHERATTTDLYLQSLRGSTKEAVKKLETLR